jgi:LysM repeat protein
MRQSISPTGEMIVDFGEPSPAPERPAHRHGSLTVRRWVSIAIVSLSVIVACCVQPLVHAQTLHANTVETAVVQPGESLWGYAQRLTPRGGDVRQTVDSLLELNHLKDGRVQAGQVLKVTVQH